MTYVQGGDLLACKRIFPNSQLWLSSFMLKDVPNTVPRFLDVDELFPPMRLSMQEFITRTDQLKREPLDIQFIARRSNGIFSLHTIYVAMGV